MNCTQKENQLLYIKHVKEKSKKYNRIMIYGAGRKGIGLYKLLTKNDISVNAFVVTNKDENKREENGLKVFGIQEIDLSNTLILIGVRTRWNEEVIRVLENYNYYNYIQAPDGIEYLENGDRDRSECSVLQITTKIGCEIGCKYCPQSTFIRKYTENMNREHMLCIKDFKGYIDQISSNVIIDFAGFSEPFLNPDCVEMIRYAHEKGHQIELFTTLVGLTESEFKKIEDISFREVVLHIPDKERNSKINITNEYLTLFERVLGLKKANGEQFVNWGSCHGEVADEVKDIVQGKLRIISQLHDRAGNLAEDILEHKHSIKGRIRCSNTKEYFHNHNVMLPDGTVLLCDSDWGMKHILGNLKEETYSDILGGQANREISRLRNENDSDIICRECCYAINIFD